MSIKMRTGYGAQPLTPEALEGELIAARDIEDARTTPGLVTFSPKYPIPPLRWV